MRHIKFTEEEYDILKELIIEGESNCREIWDQDYNEYGEEDSDGFVRLINIKDEISRKIWQSQKE